MTLSFVGSYNDRHWIQSGLTSLDIACGKTNRLTGEVILGIPTRIGLHWYGRYKIGKTHSALSIAAILAEKLGKTVLHVPIDTFDDQALEILEYCGLTKDPYIVMEDADYKSLDKSIESVKNNDDVGVAILDSVGQVSPVAEKEGSVTDAIMGRRADLIGKWARKIYGEMRLGKEEKIFIAVNHLLSNVGKIPGFHTSGGDAIQGLTSIHIKLTPSKKGMKPITFDGAWLMNGKVERANFGPAGKEFNMFIIGGLGIHRGLTAVYDCLKYDLAEEVKGVVYLQGEKMGKIKNMLEDFQNADLFKPFHDILEENKVALASNKVVSKKAKKEDEPDDDEEVDFEKVDHEYEN